MSHLPSLASNYCISSLFIHYVFTYPCFNVLVFTVLIFTVVSLYLFFMSSIIFIFLIIKLLRLVLLFIFLFSSPELICSSSFSSSPYPFHSHLIFIPHFLLRFPLLYLLYISVGPLLPSYCLASPGSPSRPSPPVFLCPLHSHGRGSRLPVVLRHPGVLRLTSPDSAPRSFTRKYFGTQTRARPV